MAPRFILFTNHVLPVAVPTDDRRYFCLDVEPVPDQEKHGYFSALAEALNEDAGRHFYNFPLQRDISAWDAGDIPPTKWRHALQKRSQDSTVKHVQELVVAGSLKTSMSKKEFFNSHNIWHKMNFGGKSERVLCTLVTELETLCGATDLGENFGVKPAIETERYMKVRRLDA